MRLFLAIELPEALRERVAAAQRRLRSRLEGWRWVRPEGIHLTVRFLGDVSAGDDASWRERWLRTARRCGPVELRVGGTGVFPSARRPRVLWFGVEDTEPPGGFRRLAAAFESAAVEAGLPAERRTAHPHLTVARADRGGRPQAPAGSEIGELGEMRAVEVVLFRSHLSPRGARYEPIAAFPLEGAT